MIATVSSEVEFGWIYLPPSLFAVLFGLAVGTILGKILNRTGLSRFFWHPPLAWLAFVTIAGSLFALFVLPP
jgi:hypothetical protein